MRNLTAKNRIILIAVLWVALAGAMFGYFFKLLSQANQKVAAAIVVKNQELGLLQTEQLNFRQAKSELDKLSKEPYQPEEFFSKDITLVKEVLALETLADDLHVDITLSNLRGTLKDAQKAKTKGEVFAVPFSLAVVGQMNDVISYIETLENLAFITNTNTISLSADKEGLVNAAIGANFYLKK